jgi:hypothetical protein
MNSSDTQEGGEFEYSYAHRLKRAMLSANCRKFLAAVFISGSDLSCYLPPGTGELSPNRILLRSKPMQALAIDP